MRGFERQIATISSRQELHRRIDALPDNAEIVMVYAIQQEVDGRRDDACGIDAVGMTMQYRSERVVFLLSSAIHFLFGGVHRE